MPFLLIARVLRITANRFVKDNSVRYTLKKAIRFVSYILILLVAVASFTGNIQSFTVAIGIISAGVAFALQEVILSVAGWIRIVSTGMYKPGDRIKVGDVKGDVIDIGVAQTTMMEMGDWVSSDNYNGRIIHLSNSMVFKHPVKNYSADFPFLWDEIKLPVTFDSNQELARKIILEAASTILAEYAEFAREHWNVVVRKYLIEDANVEPTLVSRITDNWIEFELRYVVDYSKRRITRHKLHQQILKAADNSGGAVKFASATFDIVGLPEVTFKQQENG